MRTLLFFTLLVAPSWASDSTDLQRAIELPARADGLRNAGVKEDQVRQALGAARDKQLGADEAEQVLESAEKAAKEDGPVDNFGDFVQSKLDEGLRGRELAQAIREEHAKNGKGKKGNRGEDGHEGGRGHGPDGDEKGGKGKAPDKGDKGGHGDDKGGDDKGGQGNGKAKAGKSKGKNQ
jgi:hypothetical protein